MGKILVIAEHDAGALSAATLRTLKAAQQLGATIDLALLGHNLHTLATHVCAIPVLTHVHVWDAEHYHHPLAETYAPTVASIAGDYSHILVGSTSFGKDLLPRLAALLDVQPLSDVIEIHSDDVFTHPVYAGNILEKVQMLDGCKLLTIRTTGFDAVATEGGGASIQQHAVVTAVANTRFIGIQQSSSERPELTSARIVVSGGRGIGSKENFALIERLADTLGAAVGASRAAVDAGYISNDHQVGQTGKIVAPELYVAVGISGAIQHLAGMKDSKIIVAINKDENAPIFEIADYGLVMDLFKALDELQAAY